MKGPNIAGATDFAASFLRQSFSQEPNQHNMSLQVVSVGEFCFCNHDQMSPP